MLLLRRVGPHKALLNQLVPSLVASESRFLQQSLQTQAALLAQPQPAAEADEQLELPFEPPPKRDFHPLNFDDPQAAYAAKSNLELIRTMAVLSACQLKPLVANADRLLKVAQVFPGTTITHALIRKTFFAHFCAGEDEKDIRPTLKKLHANGIGAILDYAAEDDGGSDDGPKSRQDEHSSVVARTYDYETEASCDKHKDIFMRSIMAASDAPGQGFAAIKVTALGNPRLLERVSTTITELYNLFRRFDVDDNGSITKEEFFRVYDQLFSDSTPERMEEIYDQLDVNHEGKVNYWAWSKRIKIHDVPRIVSACRESGPLAQSALSEEELELFDAMMGRLFQCADVADRAGVRLMIDAEHSFYQAAIDHAAVELSKRYNRNTPTIFQTYQCYRTDSYDRVCLDLERAQRGEYIFAAKLVRGAYMFLERARAEEKDYSSPIWEDIEHTHANYNRVVEKVVHGCKDSKAEVMIATHNQQSIEHTVALMHALDMEPEKAGVFFGQLLGMSDPLTFVLGANGYKAYKYVPFGPIGETMPYLIRRAQENGAVLKGVQKEQKLMRAELWRRIRDESALSSIFGLFKRQGTSQPAAS